MTRVGPLSPSDLDDITRVHLAAFPDSDMSRLGPGTVTRYYRWQFDESHPIPFADGVWHDDELVGFVVGGVRRDAVSGFVRRNLPAIVVAGIAHPRAASSLVGPQAVQVLRLAFRRRRTVVTGPPTDVVPASFGVLSIAVVPDLQGSGLADRLMDAAEAAAIASGAETMHLTVHPANVRAVRFYERRGWRRDRAADGWSGRMTKALDDR